MIPRVNIALAFLALAAVAWFALGFLSDPAPQRRAALERDLARLQPGDAGHSLPAAGGGAAARIAAKPALWRELIPAPPARPPAAKAPATPDWGAILAGVRPTRSQIVRGKEVIVLIKTRDFPAGRYFATGQRVGEARVKKITQGAVTFELRRSGKTFTHELRRK